MNATEFGVPLVQHAGGYWWCTLAAEMLDFPGMIIMQIKQVALEEGVIYKLNLGTGLYEFFAPWNPGGQHFPYGFRVPPDR